jgi:hypothetical protein
MLPTPIGFVTLHSAVDAVGRKLTGSSWSPIARRKNLTWTEPDIDPIITTIAEACECGELAAGYETTIGADLLDRTVWRMPNWRNYFEFGTVDLDLPLLDERGRPDPSSTARCTRTIFIRKDSLGNFIESLPTNRIANQARRGRPPKYDWGAIEQTVRYLMDENGDFSPDDPDWNAQARLEEALNDKFGIEKSAVRERLPPILQSWRKAKAGK